MQFNLSIESFNVNNARKGNSDFEKYDIDVELNELSNTDNTCMLKYGFIFSSNPKGIRLSIEGVIILNGNSGEFEKIYEKDEQNIPHILRQSYHELYPALFMITKSMNIPCPPYEISKTMDLSEKAESSEQNNSVQSESVSELAHEQKIEEVSEEKHSSVYESMNTEELTKLQIDLSKELSENYSDETKNKLDEITIILNKKISESVISS